jgi:hypothetical protein
MSYLSAKDLNSSRLVNRLWNSEAVRLIRQKRTVKFKSVMDVKLYMALMENSTDLRHEKFSFVSLSTLYLTKETAKTMNNFLLNYGPSIKYCSFCLDETVMAPNDWWIYLYNMQNLEDLFVTFKKPFTTTICLKPGDVGCTLFQVEGDGTGAGVESDDEEIVRNFRIPPAVPLAGNDLGQILVPFVGGRNSRRNVEPTISDEERLIAGSLRPSLYLPKLEGITFSDLGLVGSTETVSSFISTLLAHCNSTLRSVSTDHFSTDIYIGKIFFDLLRSSGF